jgi:hypothetical protein
MTGQRVLGTGAARQAAQEMRQILGGGLGAHLRSLIATGPAFHALTGWL